MINYLRAKELKDDEFKRPCKIWDVTTKTMIHESESIVDAAEYLGLAYSTVTYILKNKSRNHKNKLNLTITIR